MFPSAACRQMLQTRSMIAMIRGIGATSFSTASSATTGNSDSNTTNTTTTTMEDRKRLLAKASLKQVPRHGWTQDAITAAIVLEDKQFSISMSGLLTPTELVNWCMDEWNQQLVLQKKERGGMLTPYDAIQWRLQQVIPFLQPPQQQQPQQSQQQSLDNNNNNDNAENSQKRWQEAMAIGLLSSPMTTRNQLHEFIEIIAPPNSSILYKTGLGAVFVSTELFLLADDSENYQETWDFLRVRLQELNEGNFMSVMGSSSSSSSGTTSDGTFPLAATTAIASSLLEGVASVVLPTSFTSNKNKSTGTKASDYTTKSTSPNQ